MKCSKTQKHVIRCPSFAAAGRGVSLPQHQRIVSQSIPISPYLPPFCCQQSPALIFSVCFESTCSLLARLFKEERWQRKAALLKAWDAMERNAQEFIFSQWRRNLPSITKKKSCMKSTIPVIWVIILKELK